ncbi:MAG: MerR family DNA-binding transcriptional regulator [Cellvibrionales bacterium]|nr:MerR family DNA-binding transcriptional regulator [Cellvibrionales bacterium]
MTKHYSISDLSQEFDITTRTLRFYEEKGLLSPERQGQNRIYSAADRARLKLILRGKRLGLTLEESSGIIAMYDPQTNNKKQLQTLIHKIREKRHQLEQQQKDLELMILDLNDSEERCLITLGAPKNVKINQS